MTSSTATADQTSAPSRRPANWPALALFVGLLLLATGLRFYRLDAQSFWNDEGNSARLSERSLPLIIEGTASDIHPPLYYLALRGWRDLLGDTEFGLRSFSAFTGVLTVAATIALAALLLRSRRGRGATTAVLAAGLLAALNPALIYYSQETRMYALLALLAAMATLCLLRWLRKPRLWPWGAAYVLVLTAGLYTHYFFPVVIVVHAFFVLAWAVRRQATLAFNPQVLQAAGRGRRVLLTWLGLALVSLLLYLPWMPVFLRQAGGRTAVRDSFAAFTTDSMRLDAAGGDGGGKCGLGDERGRAARGLGGQRLRPPHHSTAVGGNPARAADVSGRDDTAGVLQVHAAGGAISVRGPGGEFSAGQAR